MSTSNHIIDAAALAELLTLRDLTDPSHGPHAMQQLLDGIVGALAARLGIRGPMDPQGASRLRRRQLRQTANPDRLGHP